MEDTIIVTECGPTYPLIVRAPPGGHLVVQFVFDDDGKQEMFKCKSMGILSIKDSNGVDLIADAKAKGVLP